MNQVSSHTLYLPTSVPFTALSPRIYGNPCAREGASLAQWTPVLWRAGPSTDSEETVSDELARTGPGELLFPLWFSLAEGCRLIAWLYYGQSAF